MNSSAALTAFQALLQPQQMLCAPVDMQPYLIDWRKRFFGKALTVLLPSNTAELAQIVRICAEFQVALVPQGGNTGLCGGATPDQSGQQVVVSLKRMNQIRAIDLINQTMTVEAGCILQTIQAAAAEHNLLFPLSLGAYATAMPVIYALGLK